MIKVKNLSRSFGSHRALNDISLSINKGEMVALIGASGSGKSTLLRHISGLTQADKEGGSVRVLGDVVQHNGRVTPSIRKTRVNIGVIFQQFNLVERLSVQTNVMLGALGRVPLWRSFFGMFPEKVRKDALQALVRVGIIDKAFQRASTLSGGQQQRAAIARAMVQKAKVLLADEPIASLDPESSRRVMELLAEVNQKDGVTVVVTLHQVDFAIKYCPRTVALKDGVVVYDGPSDRLTPAFLQEIYGAASAEMFAHATSQETEHNYAPSMQLAHGAA
ncbi:phosphonate ABC transporter ATP-binding protein [Desulfovibrio cuneatus]|uniref:phosphonate ABC transporter ATP-binding protein n=1 Tax=Desulfovibrio cuneatus TaxID=159728 RepID=UPI00041A127F|nr:phosphonate ABC transporter ATP-binding protein [Desulfovibrio cuneatus]